MSTENDEQALWGLGVDMALAAMETVAELTAAEAHEEWRDAVGMTMFAAASRSPVALYSLFHSVIVTVGSSIPGELIYSHAGRQSLPDATPEQAAQIEELSVALRRAMDLVVFECRGDHDLVHQGLDAIMPDQEWSDADAERVAAFGMAVFMLFSELTAGRLVRFAAPESLSDVFAEIDAIRNLPPAE